MSNSTASKPIKYTLKETSKAELLTQSRLNHFLELL